MFPLTGVGKFSPANLIKKQDITELSKLLLNEKGELQIVSYELLKPFTPEQIAYFCNMNGFYSIPTTELVDFLREEIGEANLEKTIEIAAGNGMMAKALGIKATDSFMQEREDVKSAYNKYGQPTVPYGEHVEKIDGNDAVRKYKPKVVVASWCTHKFIPKESWRGGNSLGVNEKLIIERVDKYIHIGNMDSHKNKPALAKKHRIVKADWIVSRSLDQSKNVIFIWEK